MRKVTKTNAKRRADKAFSQYIRARDSKGKEYAPCFTCKKPYPAFGVGCIQAGHFINGRHPSVVYDERNCHAQCYNCNINLRGNWVEYERQMIRKYGKVVVQELKNLDEELVKYTVEDYLEIERFFKEKLVRL